MSGCRAVAKRQEPKVRPLGIQLYMLEEFDGGPLETTLRQVAAIGYKEVELPSLYGRSGSELRALLDASSLVCPSVHVTLEPSPSNAPTLADTPRFADILKTIGARHAVVPRFPIPERYLARFNSGRSPAERGAIFAEISRAMTAEDWSRFAHLLNEKGAELRKLDLSISYHNHNVEFALYEDGRTPFDILLAETDPEIVTIELDIGWVASAGVDPAALLERHAARITQMHLKDLAATPPNTMMQINSADVGTGTVNWPDLIRAINHEARIEHVYVEQEPPFQGPRIDAARVAFEYLTKAFASTT
jgi:sugar phosphate isomerase/epimerase